MWGSHTNYLTFLALKIASLWKADPAAKPRLKVRAGSFRHQPCSFPRWKNRLPIPARGTCRRLRSTGSTAARRRDGKPKLEELVGDPADWPEPKEQEKGKEEKKKWSDFAGAFLGAKGRMHSTGHDHRLTCSRPNSFKAWTSTHRSGFTQSHGMPEPDSGR